MQSNTITDEQAAALIAQVEPVVSGPNTTKARKRGVGRLQKVLDAAAEAEAEEKKEPEEKRTAIVSYKGGVRTVIVAPEPKVTKEKPQPDYVLKLTEIRKEDPEKGIPGLTLPVPQGPHYTDRAMRRTMILPVIRNRANKMAKASLKAKKAAAIELRRTTVYVPKTKVAA